VFLDLNLGFAIRATGGEMRAESLSVFSNGVRVTGVEHSRRFLS